MFFNNIIDGKKLSKQILNQIAIEIDQNKNQGISPPTIAIILVGNDTSSQIYVNNKILACGQVGINHQFYHLDATITQTELLQLIHKLNHDYRINSILIQLPLPKQIQLPAILTAIDPNKDVDGFHPYNLGMLAQGWPKLQPCTPKGIMKMLQSIQINLIGKNAVVIGSSNIVGKPMALSLINAGCTVTICNSNTVNLREIVNNSELVISATGHPHLIKGDWIKHNSIVIDVGIKKINNKILGDVDFTAAQKYAAWITKVPGGVGPMTVACLLENVMVTQKLQ